MPENIPHLGDECSYCHVGKLIKHRDAGKGQYKDYPNLLVCPACWHKFDPDHDMAPVKTKKQVRSGAKKVQKLCLNCGKYRPDDKGLDGLPLPSGAFLYAGVCTKTGKRMADGFACGDWIPKN